MRIAIIKESSAIDSNNPAPTNANVLMLSLATGLLLIAANKEENNLDNATDAPTKGSNAIAAANILPTIISVSIKHLLGKYKKAIQKYMLEIQQPHTQIIT